MYIATIYIYMLFVANFLIFYRFRYRFEALVEIYGICFGLDVNVSLISGFYYIRRRFQLLYFCSFCYILSQRMREGFDVSPRLPEVHIRQ